MTGARNLAAASPQPPSASETPAVAEGTAILLKLEEVEKRYGSVAVLRGVSFDVRENEFLTILGPSGSGKTTILRLIGGFEALNGGRIWFDGRDIARVPVNRRPFNTVFQDYALFPHMTVRDNVGYGLRVRGASRAEMARCVDAVLETVGLERFGRRLPAELSGGQRQRVALARAIILEPRLVLLDEPLAALDVELRAQMRRFLKELQRRLGIAFLFITHDQEEAITLSDRIVVMREGRIEQIGAPYDLYYRPATRFVASFFGENNLFEGTVLRSDTREVAVETAFGALRCFPTQSAPARGDPVTIAVRSENVLLLDDGVAADNEVGCVVEDVQFAGPNVVVELRCEGTEAVSIRSRLPSRTYIAALRPGTAVRVGWAATDAAIIRGA